MSVVRKRKINYAQDSDGPGEEWKEKLLARTDVYLFPTLVLLRLLNVFAVQTSFVPDEYWQSLEVAHNSCFGFGYLTWEWTYGLRSYAYPAVFTTAYKILKALGIDTAAALVYIPRLMQGLLSALGDWYLFQFGKLYFGSYTARFVLLCCTTSWFWWYCATRTIVNSLETSALCIGLFYYPWMTGNYYSNKVIVFQIIAVSISIIRPTAAVMWIPLALWHVVRSRRLTVLMSYVISSVLILLLSSILDFWYYGKWISVHWNFFVFNVVKNMGVHYGTHPWHWYLTQGIPAVLGTHILYFVHGAILTFYCPVIFQFKILRSLLMLFWLNVSVYSLLGHKEFRFILQLVPICSIFCGISISQLSDKWRKLSVLFLIVTNVPIALYTGLVHQGGTLTVTNDLRVMLEKHCTPECPGGVLYLMPCHTTPLYSHLHINVTTRFLQCPPNLHGAENYVDEDGRFYKDPESWLDENIFSKKRSQKYEWILLFDHLYEKLYAYKPLQDYKLCKTIFHTHFPEGRTGKSIHILCRKSEV